MAVAIRFAPGKPAPRPQQTKAIMRLASILQRSLAGCAIAASLALSAPASATPLINTGWLTPPNGESYTIHGTAVVPVVNPVNTGGFTGTFGGTPIVYWCF